jgi:2-phosphosulfolactate phosphatase
MAEVREVHVFLSPLLRPEQDLTGTAAVVIDVLRASTTIVHALAAGCAEIRPVAEVDEARYLAGQLSSDRVLLAGERAGRPLPGFDLGNSPGEFEPARCKGSTLILTTTNGTHALLLAGAAERVIIAAFVNFRAVCEQLCHETRPIRIVCAGESGSVALEDTLLAGAIVKALGSCGPVQLNDAARIALDAFEQHSAHLEAALLASSGGARLRRLGYDEDIRAAARVDAFALVPELRRDPLRIVAGSVGKVISH